MYPSNWKIVTLGYDVNHWRWEHVETLDTKEMKPVPKTQNFSSSDGHLDWFKSNVGSFS